MPTVLVTGASSGFGRGLCERLQQAGWQVAGAARSGGAGDSQGVWLLPLDIRDERSVTACVDAVRARFGDIDVLVNCAGYVYEGALEDIGVHGLEAVFQTNFFGAVRMVNAVLPGMRARGRGRIITVSSAAGLMPLPFLGAYSASKHALEGYCEALRYELSPLGIDVSLVEPAFYKTGSAAHKTIEPGRVSAYEPWRQRMLSGLAAEEARAPNAEPVIRLLARLVMNPGRNRLRHSIGKYTFDYWLRGIVPEFIWERGLRIYWRLDRR